MSKRKDKKWLESKRSNKDPIFTLKIQINKIFQKYSKGNIEIITDFLEELTKNQTIPKALIEDIKWGIKALNTNKLFKNKSGGFKIPKDREDSKAWYNLLNMPSSLIINKNGEGMGNAFNLSNHAPSGLDIDQRENNVKNSSFGGPSRKDSRMDLNRKKNFSPMRARDSQDELDPFFDLIDETNF